MTRKKVCVCIQDRHNYHRPEYIFNPWLVESTNGKSVDVEGRLRYDVFFYTCNLKP
jgi:hypothetical protein